VKTSKGVYLSFLNLSDMRLKTEKERNITKRKDDAKKSVKKNGSSIRKNEKTALWTKKEKVASAR
jgi:hypothetical protein